MRHIFVYSFLIYVMLFSGLNDLLAKGKFIELVGWGGGVPQEIVPAAADTGFTDIAVWQHDPAYLKSLVKEGKKYGLGIYSSIFLNDTAAWKAKYPNLPPPLQEMNAQENQALTRINKDTSKGKSNYQYGGEPVQKIEVLTTELLCFHDPKVVQFFKDQIKSVLSVPGIKGIAFDFFGYRNYHCCYCKHSLELFKQFQQKHPGMAPDKTLDAFSLETLVAFNNELAEYTRAVKPAAKVTTHVYPVFLPDPLYGNRLDVDICGQTAAWFFEPFWSYDKIKNYTRIIFGKEKRYYPRSEGSALIGIYDRPRTHAPKSPERVEKELQAILDGGGDRVQVCSMNDVLGNKQYKAIFRKYFKQTKTKQNQLKE
ncbi:MAG: hypothetical protein WC975_05230 [Phycisphaerae bacterium]